MRPKLVIPVFLLGVGAAVWFLLALPRAAQPARSPAAPPTVASVQNPSAAASSASAFESPAPSQERAETAGDASALESGTPQTYAEQRSEELRGLGMSGDTNSLTIILSELTNRDPSVRRTAVDAAVQFGSRDAILALLDALSQTDDPEEKVALQKAIDFLKLPPVGELHAAAAPSP